MGAPEGYTRAELRGRRRKNIIFGLVSLAIIACVISVLFRLGDTLAGGDSATFAEMLAGLDWRYLLVVVALFVVAFVCDSLKFTLLNRCNGYSLGFHKDMKMALTGKYYDAITPTGSGGQPMQIYYLYKQGIPGAKSTSVTMVKYGIQMLAWTIFGAVIMIALAGTLGEVEETAMRTTIRVCAWVGFGINAFIPVFVTFVIFCPRAVSWLINLVIRLLHKIRLIKNADKLEVKIRSWMDDFSVFSQFVYKRPLVFLLLLALCLVEPVTEMLNPVLPARRAVRAVRHARHRAVPDRRRAGDVRDQRGDLYPHARQLGRHRIRLHARVRGHRGRGDLLVRAHLALRALLFLHRARRRG